MIEEGGGTSQCPICGNGEPHFHPPEEVAWHRWRQGVGVLSPHDHQTYRSLFIQGYLTAVRDLSTKPVTA